MCGFTGFFELNKDRLGSCSYLKEMNDALIHRGPDDSGQWIDPEAGIGLGHRRLSILDLSPQGHQPMTSANGRYVIAYNGEVYNFNAIRRELDSISSENIAWRGHSDTEVILAAIEQWGVENTVKKFIGMFAFSLWDRKERTLYLVRDRLGIKPLFYGWQGNSFLFGSELKAVKRHPDFKGDVDTNSLALMMRHNYIPSPYSIYKGIKKLSPGHILVLSTESSNRDPKLIPFWSAKDAAEKGLSDPFTGSENEAVTQLDSLLRDAIKLRMISDVPLGAFLSGGVDSSTVVALMQAQSTSPVKTFSIGFHEEEYNEATHAKAVANHLGTDHTELYVTAQQAMDVIPRLPTLYDEPFSDSSQIPTFLVSELARRKVTVSLSGDGGDELFSGYDRYERADYLWNRIKRYPGFLKKGFAQFLTTIPTEKWDRLFFRLKPVLPSMLRVENPGHKLHKFSQFLNANSPEEFYKGLVTHWDHPAKLVPGAVEPLTPLSNSLQWGKVPEFVERMMFLDTITYLPGDILTKVDRASMGVSLEARVPLLDHRVVEYSWKIPLSMKLKNNQTKWLLRQVLYKYVPKEMIERPKMGFGVPIDEWLRKPLRDWAENLINEPRLRNEGFFDPKMVRKKWEEHLSGTYKWHYPLWDVLMFQAWLDNERSLK